MSKQAFVHNAPGPRFVGDTFPTAAENGDSFLYTASSPKSLHVWDGNPGAGRWIFWGYLRDLADSDPGVAGYCLGGNSSGYTPQTSINKILFTTEAISTLSTGLPTTNMESRGNSSFSAGYTIGGTQSLGTSHSRVTRLAFSGETTATLLVTPTYASAERPCFDSSGFGYSVSGTPVPGTGNMDEYATSDRITFSTESITTVGNVVTPTRNSTGGQSQFAGFIFNVRQGNSLSLETQKMPFSSEVFSTVTSTLTTAFGSQGSGSNVFAAYVFGGENLGSLISSIHKFTFTSETAALLSQNMGTSGAWPLTPSGRTFVALLSYADGYGNSYSFNKKWAFLSETISALASSLASPRSLGAATQNLG